MKSKSCQANNFDIHFDEVKTKAFFPGAFEVIDIAQALFELRVKAIGNNQKAGISVPTNDDWSIFGIIGSFLTLMGHTTELLLKFKLQLDGHKIPRKHNLYVLFNRLNENSKKDIESRYKLLKNRQHPADTQWTSVDSLFQSHPEYYTDWRYVVESNSDELNAPIPFLRLAAQSIYDTL